MEYKLKTYPELNKNDEYRARKRLQNILTSCNFTNTVVSVTREYSGIYPGPHHFLHMKKVDKEAAYKL